MTQMRHETVAGRLTAVHEGGFRIIVDDGMDYAFDIAPEAAVDVGELERWRETGEQVLVHFDGSTGLHSARAYRVELTDQRTAERAH
jgi:hypothetical protein